MKQALKIYDTSLRDGTQGEGVSFTVAAKIRVAEKLDQFGIDYIEGGWPGSNPRDMAFFDEAKKLKLQHAKIAAFGSTRRASLSAEEDPEAAELFRKLNGVRVNVFETEAMADGAVDLVKDISAKLSDQGWESVVTVNSADEQVRIFMKISEDRVDGITVMAVEETEAVFVNVIGDINPAELERVMDNFDVDID